VLVHPRLPGGEYPFGGLSGSGVAFKLAWALCQQISGSEKVEPRFREFLLDATALAALGLIADVVPLHDENRIFVKHGLNRIRTVPSVGVRALLESAGLQPGAPLKAEDVAFKLAQRLNAAGRLGCARLVVELLTTTNPMKARELALYLDGQNRERQSLERKITAHAKELLADPALAELPAIVLANAEWHPGVIGIVAGRLAEAFGKPTLIVSSRCDPAPGSGRSIPGFALHEALAACDEVLCSHGGHSAAAGFRVALNQLDELRQRFCDHTGRHFPTGIPAPTLTLDAEVPLSALTFGLVKEIDRLEPYGAQNPRPRFLAGGLQIVGEPKRIGGGERHLSFRVRQQGSAIRAVAFGMAERLAELLSAGGRCCLAFTPRINEWNDMRNVEIEVSDFQPGEQARLG
jgi:single-stranded-DNA-specific exonuclease